MYLEPMRFLASRALPALPFLALPLLLVPGQAQSTLHLIPQPRQVTPHGDQPLPNGIQVLCPGCDSDDQFAMSDLLEGLAERHIPTVSSNNGGLRILLQRRRDDPGLTPEMQAEGYTIASTAKGLTLTAASASGLFYAAQTAKQLVGLDAAGQPVLHAADIRDWPVLRYRGLSDDLSRGPVDTLDFQKKLVRTLASFKANIYSPYFEHTQQYAKNPLPAPPGGAMSAADARELVAYARQYHVTVIPEQEAFGHLHHNLNMEQYSQLAETPHGTVLAPAQPGSLQLINEMFTELATLYPSPFLHIGADETVDLGRGQTKAAVDAQGLGAVYLDYLQKIDKTLKPLNRRLLFWGDIAQDSPDLVKALPADFKRNTIAIPWWYNPQPAGFARYIKPFTDAGMETWVAPGINNWSRVYPNWNYAFANIQGFTRDGVQLGATGQLNTIWYDDGEALASNNYLGVVFGAGQAWQGGQGSVTQFQDDFAPVFHGDASGKLNAAQAEIMAAHNLLKQAKVGDGSDGLFWLDPWSKDGQNYAAKLRPYTHELRLHAERAMTLIAEARAANPATTSSNGHRTPNTEAANFFPATTLRESDAIDALELGARRIDFIGLKFQLSDEIPAIYARAQADAASPDKKLHTQAIYELASIRGVNGRLEDIVAGYSLLRDMYEQLWLRTNRPYALRPVLEHYDYTIGIWYSRIDRLRAAQRQYDDLKTLPGASDLGLPLLPATH